MRTAFINALLDIAALDEDVWLLNADLGYSVLEPFAASFPDRYVNVGVAEQNMIGVAAGLAMTGRKVFVYSIGNFPTQRCLEQIRVDVCYHNAHVVVTAVGGGFSYGQQGYTHHAIEDLSVMRSLPGMRVAAPADAHETTALVRSFVDVAGPAYLRLGRAGEPSYHHAPFSGPIVGPIIVRDGEDAVILATGAILGEALRAADILAESAVSARVVSVPVLKPFSDNALRAVVGTVDVVATVEEHSLIGGLRDTVAHLLLGQGREIKLVAFGVRDGVTMAQTLDQSKMRIHCGIDGASIAAGLLSRIRGTRS